MRKCGRVTSPCCNVVLETIPVKLHGRSHLAPKVCKDGPPYGSQVLCVSRVVEVQGFITRFVAYKRPQALEVLKKSKGPRASGFQGIKGLRAC